MKNTIVHRMAKEILADRKKFLLFVFILSLAIRLAAIVAIGDFENPEMWEHGKIARNLHTGHGFAMHWPYDSASEERLELHSRPPEIKSAFIPPLNPYLIFLSFEIFGDNANSYFFLMFLNAIFSALTAIFIFKIAELISNRKCAKISSLFFAFFLPAVYGVITFSGSSLYQMLAMMVIYFWLKAFRFENWKNYIILGLISGLLALVRSEFLALGLFLFLILALKSFLAKPRTLNFKNSILPASISCLLFLTVIAPWTVRNTQLFGKFVPIVSHPWHEFWRGSNEYATGGVIGTYGKKIWLSKSKFPDIVNKVDSLGYDNRFEVRADSIFKEEFFRFIEKNPEKYLSLAAKRALYFWTIDPTYSKSFNPVYAFFVLSVVFSAFIGFVSLRKYSDNLGSYLIFGILSVFYTALITAVNLETRYQIFMLTLIFPLTGIGIEKMIVFAGHFLKKVKST